MKFFLAIALFAANALYSSQALDIVAEYPKLLALCKGAGDYAYVGVLYGDGSTTTFSYGQCYPYQLNAPTGPLAEMAVFCKTVICYNDLGSDCSAELPAPVLVPALTTLVNADDFVQIIGQGAICHPL